MTALWSKRITSAGLRQRERLSKIPEHFEIRGIDDRLGIKLLDLRDHIDIVQVARDNDINEFRFLEEKIIGTDEKQDDDDDAARNAYPILLFTVFL